jgi:hypothetical protein
MRTEAMRTESTKTEFAGPRAPSGSMPAAAGWAVHMGTASGGFQLTRKPTSGKPATSGVDGQSLRVDGVHGSAISNSSVNSSTVRPSG